MNTKISEQEISYYRLAILLSLMLCLGISIVLRIKQAKKRLRCH